MAENNPLDLGELLRRYRIAAGLTQEALAERAGLSPRAVRALENGAHLAPRRATLDLLADALRIPAAERSHIEALARQRRIPAAPGHVATTPPAPPTRRPLVGRGREQTALDAFLAGEGPRCLVFAGEPGIGKSRLVEEGALRAAAAGWTVLTAGCHRRSALDPYAPCLDALARFVAMRSPAHLRLDLQGCGWLVRLLPELAEQTALPTPTWAVPAEQERRLMFTAVARFLRKVAGPAGTLLVLDDLQWAGVDALDLLGSLLRADDGARLRVLGAYRDTDVAPDAPLAVLLGDLSREELAGIAPLGPLAPSEAAALLADALGERSTASETIQQDILTRASGVPFYILSCAHEAHTNAAGAATGTPEGVPWNVAMSIRQRMAALASPAEDVLAVAAVAERALPQSVLVATLRERGLSEDALLGALEAAMRARLLTETGDGAYRFVHDLIRETAASQLSAARRAALHRHLARVLERQSGAEQRAAELAWHFSRGDDLARALPYALHAGEAAEAVYAHVEAEAHYRHSAEWAAALGDQAREGEALERRAEALYRLARFGEACACLERAAALYRALRQWDRLAWVTAQLARAGDPLRRSIQDVEANIRQVEAILATIAAENPARDSATPTDATVVERAIALLTPKTGARIYLCLTTRFVFAKRFDAVIPVSEQAVAHARKAGEKRMESLACVFRARAERGLGRTDAAARSLALAEESARACGDLEALHETLCGLALLRETQGEFRQAYATYREVLAVATRLGDVGFAGWACCALAACAFLAGEWDESRLMLEQSGTARREWKVFGRASAAGQALLALARGAVDTPALATFKGVFEVASEVEEHVWMHGVTLLAERDILAGRAAEAVDWLRRARALAPDEVRSSGVLYAPLAWAETAMDHLEAARRLLAEGAAYRGPYAYIAEVDLHRAEALLALREGALARARAAVEWSLARSRAQGFLYAEAKALYVSGQVAVAEGDIERAREAYQAALTICDRLGEGLYRPAIQQATRTLANG